MCDMWSHKNAKMVDMPWGMGIYGNYTVPFQSIRPSQVTGLVVLAEIGLLSQVTESLANPPKNGLKPSKRVNFLCYMLLLVNTYNYSISESEESLCYQNVDCL